MTKIYDSHIHSEFSHDSEARIGEICGAAIRAGADGITITDHCDLHKIHEISDMDNIKKSYESTRGDFGIKVMSGAELGDGFTNVTAALCAAKAADFDFLLCSCHGYGTMKQVTDKFDKADFDFFRKADDEIIENFLAKYYENLAFCAKTLDYDSLAHLTFPFRYINGIAGRYKYSPQQYARQIEGILEIAVSKEKAVEVNTSGLMTDWGEIMPTREILKTYLGMGGKLITLGSDAHTPSRVAGGIRETLGALKELGFREYFYYEKRKPKAVTIE